MTQKYEVAAAEEENEVELRKLGGEASKADESPPDGDGPYDPHLHRNRPTPTTNWETLVHLLKGSLGTGILAMPKAFHNAGLIVGSISTVLIGMLCTYCLHVLVRSQYQLCKRLRVPILSYPKSMEKALEVGPPSIRKTAKWSAITVDVFLIVYQLGICCVYIVFVAKSIKKVTESYNPGLDINIRLYMLMLLVPLILINYVRNLKRLAPLSTLANIITFIGLAIVMYYVFLDLKPIEEVDYVGTALGFPLFVGTTLFALEAVGVIIALENNMKTPKSFGGYCGVLNFGMTVIVFMYVFVGFFGYVRYQAGSEGSITLNLPEKEVLAQSVIILFAIAIFITYALQCYVPVEIIWNTYLKERLEKTGHALLYEYVLRTCVVLATFVMAVAIPNLDLVISLVGALCLSALGIAFPAIIEMCVLWPDQLGKFNWILIKDLLLILCGIIGLIVGTYSAIDALAKEDGSSSSPLQETKNATDHL